MPDFSVITKKHVEKACNAVLKKMVKHPEGTKPYLEAWKEHYKGELPEIKPSKTRRFLYEGRELDSKNTFALAYLFATGTFLEPVMFHSDDLDPLIKSLGFDLAPKVGGGRGGKGGTNPSSEGKEPSQDELKIWALVRNNLKQAPFRKALLKAYGGKCAVCGLPFEAALEAAHIVPHSEAKGLIWRDEVKNGLLLCSTHHSLFDAGLLQLTEKYEISFVDPDDAERAKNFFPTQDKTLKLPKNEKDWPSTVAIKRRNK